MLALDCGWRNVKSNAKSEALAFRGRPQVLHTNHFLTMTTLSKTLATISTTGFLAGGLVDFGGFNLNPAWTVALPLGAICFGAFLISFMMEKEMAAFDEEESRKLKLTERAAIASASEPERTTRSTVFHLKGETS